MFKIYKDDKEVTSGESPLKITGIAANTSVAKGTYKVTRVDDSGRESKKNDIQGWKTLPIAVTGVTLDKTTTAIDVGATTKLTATVAPSNATDKGVTWKSGDTAIATVDSNGKVTAVKAGTATITVTTKSASKTATCAVTVTAPPEPEE